MASRPVRINIEEEPSGHKTRWIHGGRHPLRECIKNDPLQKRGWTLQETQLSVRLLYFGKHELFWQCREGVTRELAPAQFVIAADPLVPRRMFDAFAKWPANVFSRWCDLVEEYTTRGLTDRSDVLPAMSGLASELALFLRSRPGRRLATPEECRRLMPQQAALPGLPKEQRPVPSGIPLMFPGFRDEPVSDGGNASMSFILDQMEFIQGGPMPGYEYRPLRTDPFLMAHACGLHPEDCGCRHRVADIDMDTMQRILEESGAKQVFQAVRYDENGESNFDQVITNPAAHGAIQKCLAMTHMLLHDKGDPTRGSGGPSNRIPGPEGSKKLPVMSSNAPARAVGTGTSLYIYNEHAPFPALVEWHDVVQDDCYLAGLWRADLWFGLSWFAPSPGLRTPDYRAPSWSWASLNGSAIQWSRTNRNIDMLRYLREEGWRANREYVDLLDARTNVSGASAFGHVQSGRIVIWGSIVDFPFFDQPRGEELGHQGVAWPKWGGMDLPQVIPLLYRDETLGISPFSRCVFLDYETRLIVERETAPGRGEVYRRVGLWMRDARFPQIWDMVDDAPEQNAPKQVLTLI